MSTASASISRPCSAANIDQFDPHAGLLRHTGAGSRPAGGEADRRALGHRRRTAISSAISRRAGRNGTASIATTSAASGGATAGTLPGLGSACSAPAISSSIAAAAPGRASISSPPMTASRSPISGPTTRSTMRRISEDNRDGHDDNRSWNCGAEGPTDDPAILARRDRLRRATIATLLLQHGVPMILGGDEIGKTQNGNNNAYCQDNELNWLDWSEARDEALCRFRRRRSSPSASRGRCFAPTNSGMAIRSTGRRPRRHVVPRRWWRILARGLASMRTIGA